MVRLSVCGKFLLAGLLFASQTAIGALDSNPLHSSITVYVYKSGLFSGFAHDHVIIAPIAQGAIDIRKLSVEIAVSAKQMKVTDPEASESTRAEVQATMLGPKVLDADKYPEIRFKSSRIEQTAPGHYHVTGTLSLHGAGKEISFEISGGPDRYQGKTRLNQTDFGIKPITIGGGTIKVKDQLALDFDIYAGEMNNGSRY